VWSSDPDTFGILTELKNTMLITNILTGTGGNSSQVVLMASQLISLDLYIWQFLTGCLGDK
jgi:hypothetical protein